MKILKKGKIEIQKIHWPHSVCCTNSHVPKKSEGCGAKLKIVATDLIVMDWTADCGYKGMRYHYLAFRCPCCNKINPLEKNVIEDWMLDALKTHYGFSGYGIEREWGKYQNGHFPFSRLFKPKKGS